MCIFIVHVLFVKAITMLCLTLFCVEAERQNNDLKSMLLHIFLELCSEYQNICSYRYYVDKTKHTFVRDRWCDVKD